MNTIQGLWQRDGFNAGELSQILGDELDHLFWLVDVQGGLISFAALEEIENGEELLDRFVMAVPQLANTSTYLLKPAALSALGKAMGWGEWSYLVGFRAEENEVKDVLASISGSILHDQFWSVFENCGEVFVEDIDDGMAFTFTTNADWFEKLRVARPQAKHIDVEDWQNNKWRQK